VHQESRESQRSRRVPSPGKNIAVLNGARLGENTVTNGAANFKHDCWLSFAGSRSFAARERDVVAAVRVHPAERDQ
jgi:hypothetical protein